MRHTLLDSRIYQKTIKTNQRARKTELYASIDVAEAAQVLQASSGWMDAAYTALADTAMVVDGAAKDPNWWDVWMNFVEGSIKSLHTLLMGIGIDSWGITIAMFTLSVKLFLFPVSWLQLESSQKMQIIAPEAKKLAARVKDKQTLNIMTAQLYDQANVNPLAGCIPSLVQIPVFIALYRSILNLATENLLDEPFLFLPSLAGPTYGARNLDWLTEAFAHPLNPPLGSWQVTLLYCIIPAVLVVSQSVSMNLMTPPPEGPQDDSTRRTQAVLKYLPFMIGYFSLLVPSGLGIYWFVNNVFTTTSSLGMKAYFKANPPNLDFGEFKKLLESDAPIQQTFEEALADARIHAVPSRVPRRIN